MATDFNALRNNRKASFAKLMDKIQSDETGGARDTRFWRPTVDAEGTGSATIRFLPAPAGEDFPFVKYYYYNFKGATGHFYNNYSLTTLGQKDPVSELNSRLWNSTTDDESEARKMARRQRRGTRYVSNILVIRDPGDPSNEGKVFLYGYGKSLWEKVNGAMHPKYGDQQPMNPFDPWTGANFKLRIKKASGYRSYDDSTFDPPSAMANSDASIEAIWNQAYKLQPEIAADKFLSYDVLAERLREAIGTSADAILGDSSATYAPAHKPAQAPVNHTPAPPAPAQPAATAQPAAAKADEPPFETSGGDSKKDVDDVMNWLNSLG